MQGLLPLLTAGTSAGVFLFGLIWVIKFLFPLALTSRERWIIFILCYLPITFCLIFVTMKSDGGRQNPQKTEQPINEKIKQQKNQTYNLSNPISFLFPSAMAEGRLTASKVLPSFCGVEPNTYTIYLTFNADKPFFLNPGNTSLRLVLLDIDQDKGVANVELNNNGNPIVGSSKFLTQLQINQSYDFPFKDCRFRITNLGYGHFREGITMLFRTRYFINIKIEKL